MPQGDAGFWFETAAGEGGNRHQKQPGRLDLSQRRTHAVDHSYLWRDQQWFDPGITPMRTW